MHHGEGAATPFSVGPTPPEERVGTIDILRGLTLFGILAANMRGFSVPPAAYLETVTLWSAPHDRLVQFLIDVFIQGKFISIFAFLFGVGFAAQSDRAEARNAPFLALYARRLAWLCVFGLLHGLLVWYGDILLVYGAAGFALLLFRKRQDSTLLSFAIVLYLLPMFLLGIAAGISALSGQALPSTSPVSSEGLQRMEAIYSGGSWAEILRQRAGDALHWNWVYFPIIFMQTFGLFLAGVIGWRRRFFHPAGESLPRYRLAMSAALVIGVAGNLIGSGVRHSLNLGAFDLTGPGMASAIASMATVPFLSFGYVSAVILVCRSERMRQRLSPFSAVGRAALTNYLLQSVIGTLLFYGYGLGWFGRLGAAYLLLLTAIVFALQVVASAWWLSRYRFGPAEWLWRSLTYGAPQPMRRRE